jgi:site-specific recombinase XerD
MALFDFPKERSTAFNSYLPPDLFEQVKAQQHRRLKAEFHRRTFDKLIKKIGQKDIAGKEHIEDYLRHKYRRNCRANTLCNDYTAITLFMSFLKTCAKTTLEQIGRDDLYAFIEHEQDRGLKISSVQNRVASLQVFLKFLIEAKIVNPKVLSQPIRLKVPKALPRAMEPYDVNCLLTVLDDVRNRAMILLLLRTGMRIGELLNTKLIDVHSADKKIMIFEGEKNRKGRAVCFSNDAHEALQAWLKQRETPKEYLFYAQGRYSMSYNNARVIFHRYLKRAGLTHKGYTLHCLRHTFATELLNAGMRIECLQQLLGHSNLEMTLRYAKLSDRTREQEYFKAMNIIESEEIHEPDQCDRQLPPPFEAPQLLDPYS